MTELDVRLMQERCDDSRGKLKGQQSPQSSGQTTIRQPKRIRQSSKPLLNKLENDFYAKLLQKFAVQYIHAQAIRLKLGNSVWYKPDFVVTPLDARPQIFECKGPHCFRGGKENLKIAASLWPQFDFWLVWKQNQQWNYQFILP